MAPRLSPRKACRIMSGNAQPEIAAHLLAGAFGRKIILPHMDAIEPAAEGLSFGAVVHDEFDGLPMRRFSSRACSSIWRAFPDFYCDIAEA